MHVRLSLLTDLPVEEYEVGGATYWDCNLSSWIYRIVWAGTAMLERCVSLGYMESSNADVVDPSRRIHLL